MMQGAPRLWREGSSPMLWLIWIALMLLTPVVAGVRVWLQLRGEAPAEAASEAQAGSLIRE
jgi:hypothetical protein